MTRKEIKKLRAEIAMNQGINLEKDYFLLNTDEIITLCRLLKATNYNGKNYLGRSELRQFYYHLQNGYRELKKEA